jgi:hypothetical protein
MNVPLPERLFERIQQGRRARASAPAALFFGVEIHLDA